MYIFAREYESSVGIVEVIHDLYASVNLVLDGVKTPSCYVALACMVLHH